MRKDMQRLVLEEQLVNTKGHLRHLRKVAAADKRRFGCVVEQTKQAIDTCEATIADLKSQVKRLKDDVQKNQLLPAQVGHAGASIQEEE